MIVLAVLAYAAWFVYTRNAKHSAPVWGHRWAARIAAAVCRLIGLVCGLTFAVKFEDEAGLQAEHRGLVAAVGPHGVFPLAMLGFGAFKFRRDCGFGEPGLTELNARFAGASVCFLVPVIRELLLLMGVRDANRSTLKRLLASNHSVAIQPGGIWEMVMSDSRQEALFFQRSLGFVRLAIEMGRPLLPCYSFGENQLFKSWGGHGLRLWVARKLRIGLPFFQGRWGLPLCPLPRPTDVTFVVGRQVPVGPANPRPSEAEVEAVFERYLEEIERLFAANAPKYLPPDVAARGLKIHRIGHGVVRHARL
jgi:2-acylglycerol O-acyltransferase 2